MAHVLAFANQKGGVAKTTSTLNLGVALTEMGKTPSAMTRDEKREVVRRLEERGAFLVKRSAEQVAEALDLSRYTIFAYLKEIRHGEPAGSAAPERPATGGGGQ